MQRPRSRNRHSFSTVAIIFASIALSCIATLPAIAQDQIAYVYSNQQVQVSDLPTVTASSNVKSAVLAAALETILQDQAVCCGKDSALKDVLSSTPSSLQDLSGKLRGKHVMGDGQTIAVAADYIPQSSINPDLLIGALREQHALLIEWRAHFYVLYGAVFDKTVYSSGRTQLAIRKLSLRDPRFSDGRAEVEFNRGSNDWGEIQGILKVTAIRQ